MNVAVTYLVKDNEILFLYKETRSYFVAPGGKQDEGETIQSTAKREFFEETGLVIAPMLASISQVTLKDERGGDAKQFSLFTFFATDYSGVQLDETREGRLGWKKITDIDQLPMFIGDKMLLQNILQQLSKGIVNLQYATFLYSDQYRKLENFVIEDGN